METMKISLIKTLGLPDQFGYVLLLAGLVFCVAPYLGGTDFGVFKVPSFEQMINRRLRYIGPLLLAIVIMVHVPTIPHRNPETSPATLPNHDESSTVTSGHAIVFDGNIRYNQSGFSFSTDQLVAWDSGRSDILVEDAEAEMGLAHFFLQYDSGDKIISDSPFDALAKSGIIEIKGTSLEAVDECPLTGYQSFRVAPRRGGLYCVRTRDGAHFAKIRVVDVRHDRIAFDWQYQKANSRRFK